MVCFFFVFEHEMKSEEDAFRLLQCPRYGKVNKDPVCRCLSIDRFVDANEVANLPDFLLHRSR